MKIIFILVGFGLTFAFFLPSTNTFIDNPVVRAVLFYLGIVILLGGLGGVADWLEHKAKNNQDGIET